MERGPYRHQFRSRFLSFLDTIHRSDEGGRRCPSLLPPCVLISVERPRNGGECRLPGHPRNLQGRAEELTGCSTHCTDFSFVCVGRSHIESHDECAQRSCLVTSGNIGTTRTKPAHSPVAVVVWHRRIACLLSDPDQQKPQRDHIRI